MLLLGDRPSAANTRLLCRYGDGRGHSERIHQLGDSNLTHISRGREQSEQMLQLASELDQATLAFKG